MWRLLPALLAALVLLPAALVLLPAALLSPAHAADPRAAAARIPQAAATEAFVLQAAGVLAFAHQMVLDYTAAGMKFRQAVAEAKLPPPRDAYDAGHKALADELGHTAPGKPFAKAYVEMQGKTLRDDLPVFEAYARSGDNERLKLFAQEMVPLLRGHLEQAERLHK